MPPPLIARKSAQMLVASPFPMLAELTRASRAYVHTSTTCFSRTTPAAQAGSQSPADGAVSVGDASHDAAESSFTQPGADKAAHRIEHQATHAAARQYTETEVGSDDDSVQILDDLTNRNDNTAAADSRRGAGQDVDMRDGNVASDQSVDAAESPAIPPDHPLPHRTYKFDILDYAPARHPSAPLAYKPLETMTSQERSEEHLREQDRLARERAQRQLREVAGNEWAREWRDVKGKQRDNTQNTVRTFVLGPRSLPRARAQPPSSRSTTRRPSSPMRTCPASNTCAASLQSSVEIRYDRFGGPTRAFPNRVSADLKERPGKIRRSSCTEPTWNRQQRQRRQGLLARRSCLRGTSSHSVVPIR